MSFHRESGLIRFSFLLLSINQFYFMLGKSIFDPSFHSSYFLTSLSLSRTHTHAHYISLHYYVGGGKSEPGGQHPHFLCNLMVSKKHNLFPFCQLDIYLGENILICVSLRSPMTLLYLFLVIHYPIASVPGINSTAKRIKLMITLLGNQRPIHFKICLFISPIQPVMRISKMILMQGSYQSLL